MGVARDDVERLDVDQHDVYHLVWREVKKLDDVDLLEDVVNYDLL